MTLIFLQKRRKMLPFGRKNITFCLESYRIFRFFFAFHSEKKESYSIGSLFDGLFMQHNTDRHSILYRRTKHGMDGRLFRSAHYDSFDDRLGTKNDMVFFFVYFFIPQI